MKTKFTFATRLEYTKFGLLEKSIHEVIDIIRHGDIQLYEPGYPCYSLKEITEVIRNERDPCKQNECKEKFLPVVFFNGVWNGKRISEYSSITALDFDNIFTDEQYHQTIGILKSCAYVIAVFRTFKPRRIKALVMHDNTDPAKHTEMYARLIEYFGLASGIDTSCKDLSRKSFIPWDENIWVNPDCQPFHFVPTQSTPTHTKTAIRSTGKTKSQQSIISILNSSWRKKHPEYWLPGNRANSIFKCACQFCEYGVPQEMAEEYFMNGGWIAHDFTEEEVSKHVSGAYKCNQKSYGSKDFI